MAIFARRLVLVGQGATEEAVGLVQMFAPHLRCGVIIAALLELV